MDSVSIVVPTTCDAHRWPLLQRALNSVRSQSGVRHRLIVVVNGARVDEARYRELLDRADLNVIRLAEGNVSAARYAGVCQVDSDYFGFLDDDDELLPEALATRLRCFASDTDIVSTNGYHYEKTDSIIVDREAARLAKDEPFASMARVNWFSADASLFRTNRVDKELLNIDVKHFEWTYLFYLLISKGTAIRFHDVVTYRRYADSPNSVSKTDEYARAYPDLLARLMEMNLPDSAKRELARKQVVAMNGLSQLELSHGNRRDAWRAHLRCLRLGGWRYLPYTLHLLVRGKALRS